MKISRRDTIIIASLMNVSLLALLFATSSKLEDSPVSSPKAIQEAKTEALSIPEIVVQAPKKEPVDEIDQVLQEYALKQKVVVTALASPKVSSSKNEGEGTSDVIVKKGDKLQKIAKAHGVKVEEIMKENALTSPQLKVGQPLKIPKKTEVSIEPEYYVIKSGDNPWKVAKKYGLKYEELLRLNGLNEEKAKNLKIGQKIRIK